MLTASVAAPLYNKTMLQLSGYLLNKPILSLRIASPVAWITAPIINPRNLKIEGFYCTDSQDGTRLVLLCQDIRELSRQGFIVDDHDVLVEPDDLVRLQDLIELNFQLPNKPVQTVSKQKVGKVSDYAIETESMFIQKLYVTQSFWKRLTGGSLSVDRSQVVEITKHRIVINDLLEASPSPATAAIA